MTGPTPAEKLVEEVARAICKARGIDPDAYVQGSGGTGQPIVCHVRGWQQHIGPAHAAIAVVVGRASVSSKMARAASASLPRKAAQLKTPSAPYPRTRNMGECALAKCASSFPYHEECGLVASGCCARDMLAALRHQGAAGTQFPLDLHLDGNPFVNAMVKQGLVRVNDPTTFLRNPTHD